MPYISRPIIFVFVSLAASLGFLSTYCHATDHWDGPAVTKNTSADITDFFAVSLDSKKMLLIMNVNPGASADTPFLPDVRYSVRFRPINGF